MVLNVNCRIISRMNKNLVWERVVKDIFDYCRELLKTFEEK